MKIDDDAGGDALSVFQSLREKLQAIQVTDEQHEERGRDEFGPMASVCLGLALRK